jgi:DDE superfamily endonuclease
LADAEPISGAQHREVQRLQWFLSESAWDHEVVNQRRVRLLCQDSATAPNDRGVLMLDDTGDRKDGTATAHVARQYLDSEGKVDNGIVAVTSLWADERGLLAGARGALHAGVAATSRSDQTGRSADTGRWCVARSASAGRPSSPTIRPNLRRRPTPRPPRRSRGGRNRPVIEAEPAARLS